MINVDIQKNNNENNANMLRRFTQRIRSSGIINRMKGLRYHDRELSPYTRKQKALKRIARQAEHERLYKLGKKTHTRRRR